MFWVGCVTQLLLLHPGHINPAWLRVLHRTANEQLVYEQP